MRARAWLPVVLGLIVGIAGGLYYAWAIDPVEYTDTSPASLRADFKAAYLTLIASAYAADGDLGRAQARLALFPDPDPSESLAILAQQLLAAGVPSSEARAVALLSSDLEGAGATVSPGIPSASSPAHTLTPTARAIGAPSRTPTRTPTRTATRTPTRARTRTPTLAPASAFELESRQSVCDADLVAPLIQVVITAASGDPIPGVEIVVVWDEGEDHFFTGLKPELGLGYADFTMTPGVAYTLQLPGSGEPVTGLQVESCVGDDGQVYPGSWRLVFIGR